MAIKYSPSWLNNSDLAYASVVTDFLKTVLVSVRTQVLNVVTRMSAPVINIADSSQDNNGAFKIQTAREIHTLALAATSDTTTISIPIGAILYGAQLVVTSAVTTSGATNTFSTAFITGSTTAISSGTAGALNTKVNTLIVPEKTAAGIAQIRFDAAGVETFTAGEIDIIVYYATLTTMASV